MVLRPSRVAPCRLLSLAAACAAAPLVLAAPVLGSLAACSSSSSKASTSTDASNDAAATDAPSDEAPADDAPADDAPMNTFVKIPIQGLIDMQSIGWHDTEGGEPTFTMANVEMFPGVFGGIVVNATWDAIQPTAAGALDFSTIDDALDQVRAYNAANPSAPLGVKLRVYQGSSAPEWAKELDGGPVAVVRNAQGCTSGDCPLTVGAFWAPDYIAAWRTFQASLAARYDADPIVRQVAVTSCASQTDEPFVPTTDAASRLALSAAGYTDAAQMACLSGAVADYAAWKLTLVDYTFNTFDTEMGADSGPHLAADAGTSFALSVMAACRSALGPRCVLDNHALSDPLRDADLAIYQAIGAMGGPTNFQTDAPAGIHCEWAATVAEGAALGAEAIELWPAANLSGFDTLTAAELTQLASELSSPIPVPPVPDAPPSCPGFN